MELERRRPERGAPIPPLTVALSASRAEDLGRFGLRPPHLESIFVDLSRCLLGARVRVAYAGHLQAESWSIALVELVQSLLSDEPSGVPRPERGRSPGLVAHLAWPMRHMARQSANWGPSIEVRECGRPADIDEGLEPGLAAVPLVRLSPDSPRRRFAWARGLSVMRERQTAEVAARIVVGGKVGTAGGYLGRMPGVLEETLLAVRAGQPVYLIGAFGGCACAVVDALDGVPRRELTWDYHRVVPHSKELKELYAARGLPWDDYEDVADELQALGFAGLRNGLSIDENRELAKSRSCERIAALVLRGLERCYPEGTRQWDE